MPVTESHKRSIDKWNAKNMSVIACKIYKNDAEDLRKYAKDHGMTTNALMRELISKCLGRPLTKRSDNVNKPEIEEEMDYPDN